MTTKKRVGRPRDGRIASDLEARLSVVNALNSLRDRGYSDADLAREWGYTPLTIGRWRRGEYLPKRAIQAQIERMCNEEKLAANEIDKLMGKDVS